jgi:hypothetical protein
MRVVAATNSCWGGAAQSTLSPILAPLGAAMGRTAFPSITLGMTLAN